MSHTAEIHMGTFISHFMQLMIFLAIVHELLSISAP